MVACTGNGWLGYYFDVKWKIARKFKQPGREVSIYQIWSELCPNTPPQDLVRNGGVQWDLTHSAEDNPSR